MKGPHRQTNQRVVFGCAQNIHFFLAMAVGPRRRQKVFVIIYAYGIE
jgi:hypothetical protein